MYTWSFLGFHPFYFLDGIRSLWDPVVRDTANKALGRLKSDDFKNRLPALWHPSENTLRASQSQPEIAARLFVCRKS